MQSEAQTLESYNRQSHSPTTGYGIYFLVWLGLLVLTSLTVAVAGLNLGGINVITALLVALLKTSLVLLFFMHLKYEDRVLFIMFMVAMATLTVIIGITFLDILYRQ